jgi:hypothetical protein
LCLGGHLWFATRYDRYNTKKMVQNLNFIIEKICEEK